MKKKFELFLIFSVMVAVIMSSCVKNDPVRIAVIISSTGSGSHMSETTDGIMLAAEELNEWGGINERPVELIVRDNETSQEKAVELFNELEQEYNPEIYITALSSMSIAIAPLAQQNKVPLLCLVSSNTDITKTGDYIFRFYVSAAKEIPPIMYFIDKKRLKNVAVIYRNDALGIFIMNLFEEVIKAENTVSISSFAYEPENTDIGKNMDDILKAQSVYVVGYATDMSDILIQLHDVDYNGVILAHSSVSQTQVRELAAADGICCSAPIIYNSNYSYAAELKDKFESEFNTPLNHYGANGYEAVKIFASLMEGKEINREEIRTQLSGGFVNTGSLGKIFVKEGSRDFDFELMPAVIKNGNLSYE